MTNRCINKNNPLLLASASPRRKALLEQIKLPIHILPAHVDESQVAWEPSLHARILAEAKAKAAYAELKNHWTLGADTIVVLEETVLGKPRGSREVEHMLSALSGKEHEVITAFSLLDPGGSVSHAEEVFTRVKMKPIGKEEIGAYIATGEPFGKAGSYAIQGTGAFLVESISGSYSNVVGLPLCALVKALLNVGALESFPIP
jgi:septum formation protein